MRKRLPYAAEYIRKLRAAGYTIIDEGSDVVIIERAGRRVGCMDVVNNLRLIGETDEIFNVIFGDNPQKPPD